jgi:hypothetical protein
LLISPSKILWEKYKEKYGYVIGKTPLKPFRENRRKMWI